MIRARFAIGFLVVLIPLGVLGSLAFAGSKDVGKLPSGAKVGDVAVGGLSQSDALAKLREDIGAQANRAITVQVGARQFKLSADDAGVTLDLPAAVQRAYDESHEGNFVQRGWRKITGDKVVVDEPIHITSDAKAVRSFVGKIHAAVAHKAVDATLSMTISAVTTTQAKPGARLAGRDDLVTRIVKALQTPDGRRSFSAHVATVAPKVADADLFGSNPIALTVSKHDKLLRVFDKGKLVRRYHVAVGMEKYPTPNGQFSIQGIEKNPVWTVPNSDWAGDLAGKVIPGGDPQNPLKAYFIRFDGAVGFHGTASLDSLGTAASHGCVRMDPKDVTDLAKRVTVGTPVLVG